MEKTIQMCVLIHFEQQGFKAIDVENMSVHFHLNSFWQDDFR
jgi:hypothetical protein